MEGFLEGATRGPAEQVGGGENISAKEPKPPSCRPKLRCSGNLGTANHPLPQT